jgi:DME family drug/metabolite transporter
MIQTILQSRFSGGFALLSAALIYATFGVFIRAMAEMFGDSTQVAVRFGLVAIILAAYMVCRRRSLRLHKNQARRVLAMAIGCAALVILFTYAITTTTIASSVFSLYAGSIITSLLIGTLAFKETLTPLKIVAICVALAGLTVYAGGFVGVSLGIAAAFLAGILDGVTNALRKALKGVDRIKVQVYQNGVGAFVAALLIPFLDTRPLTGSVSWWPVLATVLFVSLMIGLGYLLLYGFQHFDVNAGTIILATELFFATCIGIICFRELPGLHEILGGCLIFGASVLTIGKIPALPRWRKN